MWCIDPKNGLYITTKNSHGVRLPIHTQKCIPERKYDCEVEECRDFMNIAAQGGDPGKECLHLERTRNSLPYITPAVLCNESINEVVDKGIVSSSRREECISLFQRAQSEEVDCLLPIFLGKHGLSERYIYFSVFTGEKDNWCRFGRTISTFDTKLGKWHCQCVVAKIRSSCVHRCISMWWLFQERRHLVKNAMGEDFEDIEESISGNVGTEHHLEYTQSSVIAMTNYLWNSKRIPEELPLELTKTEMPIPDKFEPAELTCPYCPGPCPPDLENVFLITTHATIYGIFSQNKGRMKTYTQLLHTSNLDKLIILIICSNMLFCCCIFI
ncbi:uncharacterized protein [Misgurnus anguillicaudatus]|uniref:uncharacterized protein n=1 Tax=Misgurnus anguillicaudatus TaxID=75329 RepID=UPI003CCF9BDD